MTLKRQAMQIVEVDYDFCTRTYGSSPCAAVLGTTGDHKCFNTFATCQDTANYDKGTLTVRYCKAQSGLPKGEGLLPFLVSVTTSPTEISLGAPDENIGTLGKRASVTIKLMDATGGDWLTDPHYSERISGAAQADGIGYLPNDFATYFLKQRARHPYFQGRRFRIKNGFVGDDIASIPAREYAMTGWARASDGSVTHKGKDLIDLTDNRKAVYPPVSEGKIGEAIADSGLPTFDLTPAGVGADYEASGYATIGTEIVGYTIATDTVTITQRGAFGTTPEEHAEGDAFQQAAVFQNALLQDVAETIFLSVTNITADDLDTTQWEAQIVDTLGGFKISERVISTPRGVRDLLSELTRLGLTFYSDDITGKIKCYVNSPLAFDENSVSITDATDVLENTLDVAELADQITTQVVIYHGVRSWTDDLNDPNNYSRLFTNIDADLRSENALGQDRVKTIFMPWFGRVGDDSFALAVGTRYATRYGEPQQRITFTADYKDVDKTELTTIMDVTTGDIVTPIGQSNTKQFMVVAREDVDPGHRVKVTVQTYQLEGRWIYLMDDTTDSLDYDSATDAEKAKGWYLIDETDPDYPLFDDGQSGYQMF